MSRSRMSPPRFEHRQTRADALTTAEAKTAFGHWLSGCCPTDRISAEDVLLAVYEALANAAEHAYGSGHGRVELTASYDAVAETLNVVVHDHGHWPRSAIDSKPEPRGGPIHRGRGIPLMHALTDRALFLSDADGTTVDLSWNGIRPLEEG